MSESAARAAAPDVSIVIVSWNTRDLLERCLASAFAASPGLTREVIVVDNASSDGSADHVAGRWPEVALVRNRENRGYAPACNPGRRAARGRHVLALNSDAFLAPDSLDVLVRHLDEHPEVAAAGPRLAGEDGSTQRTCARRAPRLLPSLFAHTMLLAYFPGLRPWMYGFYPAAWYERPGEPEVLSGACLLFRRAALERVGLLDDRLVLNYDDVEWSLRARRHGLRLAYVPAAAVTHLGGASRVLDLDSASVATLDSNCTFWELAFPSPAVALLEWNLILSLSLTLLKNSALAPFVRWRRDRVARTRALIGRVASRLLSPRRTEAVG